MAQQTRLYLIAPLVTDAEAFAPLLAEVCGAGDVAAVLVPLVADDERTTVNRIKRLAPIAQEHGTAFIVVASPQAAIRGGADGVHLAEADPDAIAQAAAALRPDRIVGVGGLPLRHDAMAAGEADVDYVMFGEPTGGDEPPRVHATVERATWWAEVFTIPCVAYCADLDAVPAIAATGAEFVALGEAVFAASGGAADAVRRACELLAAAEPSPP